MKEHISIKVFDGYSIAFRQWRATHSHCQYIHGYALKFKVWFEGELDEKNWVCDFGCFKRNGIKEELANQFDHTMVVASDDPHIEIFRKMDKAGLVQLRVMEHVGCERYAEWVFNLINDRMQEETSGRVKVLKVESFEGGTDNSAIYYPNVDTHQPREITGIPNGNTMSDTDDKPQINNPKTFI
jgi:6-pyruvoyltetrahydropterin/6-carboxytetrahydropterin synthase